MRFSPELLATVDELTKHGADVVEITRGGKHYKVHFARDGLEKFVTCSSTGSDWRGPMNARQQVRETLGIKRWKVGGKRRPNKRKAMRRPVPAPDHFTPGPDPFAKIYGAPIVQAALAIAAERTWNAWFGQIMRENGHVPVNPMFGAMA